MNTLSKSRAKRFVAIASLVLAWSSRLPAQVPRVRQLEVGGYVLALGMTAEQLREGIGKAFQYRYFTSSNSFLFFHDDALIARVFLKNGKALSIEKMFSVDSRDDGVNAIDEFLALRRTTNCAFQLVKGYAGTEEIKVLRTLLTCGNVGLSTEIYFRGTDPQETGYAISIRQIGN